MRLGCIELDGGAAFAVEAADGRWLPLAALGVTAATTREAIEKFDEVRRRVAGDTVPGVAEPTFRSPVVAPSKILAIGLNYMDHIRETGSKAPESPVLFAKFPSSVTDPFGALVVDPELTEKADYEVELAVVIGRRTRSVPIGQALESVFGYTVANDVSARDWQFKDGQFSRSKSFDTFCPIGPWITTSDEVADPNGLTLRSLVNGEVRQDSSTEEMIFPVAHLIWYLSRGMTLEPGDVILTGTPHGVGTAMDPPRYLVPGDTVECEVEGLGVIRNEVVRPGR